mmetsp:Transcript_10072/g.41044  ORF Transcript_10072/g.41044 Transcript_10072/m.41044 type:complete len:265 (+) Transcript_10072:1058-1852(+)
MEPSFLVEPPSLVTTTSARTLTTLPLVPRLGSRATQATLSSEDRALATLTARSSFSSVATVLLAPAPAALSLPPVSPRRPSSREPCSSAAPTTLEMLSQCPARALPSPVTPVTRSSWPRARFLLTVAICSSRQALLVLQALPAASSWRLALLLPPRTAATFSGARRATTLSCTALLQPRLRRRPRRFSASLPTPETVATSSSTLAPALSVETSTSLPLTQWSTEALLTSTQPLAAPMAALLWLPLETELPPTAVGLRFALAPLV